MMRKALALIAAGMLAVVGIGTLTGCTSTLKAGLERKKQEETYVEIDLDQYFSKEEGYHYPGVAWGSSLKTFNINSGYTVDELQAYGSDMEKLYSAKFKVMALGRENTDGTICATDGDLFYMASYLFSGDEFPEGALSQSELYDQYLERLSWVYGEPTEYTEEEKVTDSATFLYRTNTWVYVLEDGKETRLQFSSATTPGKTEPTYITLGVVWVNPE